MEVVSICFVCDKTVTGQGRRKFCSDECRKIRDTLPALPCQWCEKEVKTKETNKLEIFCNQVCKRRYLNKLEKIPFLPVSKPAVIVTPKPLGIVSEWCKKHSSFKPCQSCTMDAREKKYGINKEKQIELYVKQEARCGLCQLAFSGLADKRLKMDHDHSTGEVRGYLCNRCNCFLAHCDYYKQKERVLDIVLGNVNKYLKRAP